MQGYQFELDNKIYRFKTRKNARISAYHYGLQSNLNSIQLEELIKSIIKFKY